MPIQVIMQMPEVGGIVLNVFDAKLGMQVLGSFEVESTKDQRSIYGDGKPGPYFMARAMQLNDNHVHTQDTVEKCRANHFSSHYSTAESVQRFIETGRLQAYETPIPDDAVGLQRMVHVPICIDFHNVPIETEAGTVIKSVNLMLSPNISSFMREPTLIAENM